jgi:type IV secretion system protein TrbL
MDEGNLLNDVLKRTLDFVDHGFGLIQGDVYWLFATLLLVNVTLAGLAWATSEDDVVAALARRILYVGFFAWLVTRWPTLVDTVGRSFVQLGLKAGNASGHEADFYDPGRLVATGWAGAWRMLEATRHLTGVRATFVNLPEIAVLLLAAVVYFVAFAMLAFQVFGALVQFKVGSLAAFVLLPMALVNKTAFLAERPIGWVVSGGVRLMCLALVMAIGLDLVQTAAAVPAEALTVRGAVAAALGAASLLLLGRMAAGLAGELVPGSPGLGVDGGMLSRPAGRAAASAGGATVDGAAAAGRWAGPQAGRAARWAAVRVASLVPGGAAATTAAKTAKPTGT